MTEKPVADLSFEEAIKELEQVVSKLEGSDVALEDSIALYQRGQELRKLCDDKLKSAEEKISLIDLGADGAPKGTTPATGL